MHPAFSMILSKVDWNVFCTLTVKRELSEERLKMAGIKWVQSMAHHCRVTFSEMPFVLRVERGEVGDRLHLHALLKVDSSRMGYFLTPGGTTSVAHRTWGIGITEFRSVHSSNDPAISYVLKETRGNDEYELGKTSRASGLVLSNALARMARARLRRASIAGGDVCRPLHTTGQNAESLRDHETMACKSGVGIEPA